MLTVFLQIYYFLWILLLGSFIYFMIRRKYINSSQIGDHKILLRSSMGIVVTIIALLYYVVICGVLGWSFRSIILSYFFTFTVFILLDIFLLGFSSKNYQNSVDAKIERRLKLSITYTTARIVYTAICICTLFFSFFGGIFASLHSIFYLTITTPEMFIDVVRHTIIQDETSNIFIYRNKWDRYFQYGDVEPLAKSTNYNFGNDLFCVMMYNDNPDGSFEVHIYKPRLLYFKEYLYTVRGKTFRTGLHYSSNKDTLFIGQSDNQNPQNYIVKKKDIYIHTKTRLSNASGLDDNQIQRVSMNNSPDRFTTEKRIIR